MERRKLLQSTLGASAAALAGCLDSLSGASDNDVNPGEGTGGGSAGATDSAAEITVDGWPRTTLNYNIFVNGVGGDALENEPRSLLEYYADFGHPATDIPAKLERWGLLSAFALIRYGNRGNTPVFEEYSSAEGAKRRVEELRSSMDVETTKIPPTGTWSFTTVKDSFPAASYEIKTSGDGPLFFLFDYLAFTRAGNVVFFLSLKTDQFSDPKEAAIDMITEADGDLYSEKYGFNDVMLKTAVHYKNNVEFDTIALEPGSHDRYATEMASVDQDSFESFARSEFGLEMDRVTELTTDDIPEDQYVGYKANGRSDQGRFLSNIFRWATAGRFSFSVEKLEYYVCSSPAVVRELGKSLVPPARAPGWGFRGGFFRAGEANGVQYVDAVGGIRNDENFKFEQNDDFGIIKRFIFSGNVALEWTYGPK